MQIFVAGINHKTAPIGVREKLYLSETEREVFLSSCQADPSIAEVIVLSTCNRTEVYAHVLDGTSVDVLFHHLFRVKKLTYTAEILFQNTHFPW